MVMWLTVPLCLQFLFVDQRGRFHCLFHRGPFSDPSIAIGHAFSIDSYTWHQSPEPACNSTIEYEFVDPASSPSSSGGNVKPIVFGKRERPHLLFDKKGAPTHLITGVCLNPACDPWSERFDASGQTDCSAKAQYMRCDRDWAPGFFDRTWTHVQEIPTTGAEATPGDRGGLLA